MDWNDAVMAGGAGREATLYGCAHMVVVLASDGTAPAAPNQLLRMATPLHLLHLLHPAPHSNMCQLGFSSAACTAPLVTPASPPTPLPHPQPPPNHLRHRRLDGHRRGGRQGLCAGQCLPRPGGNAAVHHCSAQQRHGDHRPQARAGCRACAGPSVRPHACQGGRCTRCCPCSSASASRQRGPISGLQPQKAAAVAATGAVLRPLLRRPPAPVGLPPARSCASQTPTRCSAPAAAWRRRQASPLPRLPWLPSCSSRPRASCPPHRSWTRRTRRRPSARCMRGRQQAGTLTLMTTPSWPLRQLLRPRHHRQHSWRPRRRPPLPLLLLPRPAWRRQALGLMRTRLVEEALARRPRPARPPPLMPARLRQPASSTTSALGTAPSDGERLRG
jgi:hypothetical protein